MIITIQKFKYSLVIFNNQVYGNCMDYIHPCGQQLLQAKLTPDAPGSVHTMCCLLNAAWA